MKILSACQSLLTNTEVLQVLQERGKAAGPSETLLMQHLNRLVQDQQETDAAKEAVSSSTKPLDEEQVKSFMDVAQEPPFSLTRIEVLQMINLAPKSAVEVHLVVESCDERLTEDQIEDLLRLVRETLN